MSFGAPRPARTERASADRLSDFERDVRVIPLSLMAVLAGAVSSLVAYALVLLIAVITNISYSGRYSTAFVSPDRIPLHLWSILVPVAGGLLVGLMARYGSEKIRGHGIPEALESILVTRSRMEPRVAILKPVSSAVSIGTGGPFGAEGPIIMTGGAFGSLFAQMFHLSSAERKTLLVAGAAAGMTAIFAAPLASVLIAVELLLFEWRPRSLIPVGVACAVAAVLRVPLLGSGPIFPVPPHPPMDASQMLLAFVVGLVAGLASSLLTLLVYWCEDLFGRLPIHWMWWPAIGGIAVGIGGLVNPRVLGVGYDTIHDLLLGRVVGPAVVSLLVGKALVWSLSLGSGTSGGVLAPLLIMGGALGAGEARFLPTGSAGLWALISMAALMGGTMRSPLTSIVFALELTHDLNVLPGLLIAAIAADAVTVLLMRRSILTEKVARHGHHVYREYAVDPLELVFVSDVMDTAPPTVTPETKVADLCGRIARADPLLTRRTSMPIVEKDGRLAGLVTRGDLVRALQGKRRGEETVLEAGSGDPLVAYPDETVRTAVDRMLQHDVGRLLVVGRGDPRKLLGYLGRPEVMATRLRSLQDEIVREAGIVRTRPPGAGSASPTPKQQPQAPTRALRRPRARLLSFKKGEAHDGRESSEAPEDPPHPVLGG
jgi:chloride channel protein, CIC family